MRIMNRRKLFVAVLLLCCGLMGYGQEDTPSTSDTLALNEIFLRFDPVLGGTPRVLSAKTINRFNVKVGSQYERVDKQILRELERKRSATYWYEVAQDGDASHYLVRARTRKNAIGVNGSYLFYGDFTHHRDWLMDEYKGNFEGAAFGLRDFSVGLLYARQLFGVNRHRIIFEIEPGYRQIAQSFSADRYTTSYPTVDPDGLEYQRLVTVTDYAETVNRHCVEIPLDLRYDLFVFKYLSLFLSGGIDNVFVATDDAEATFDASYAGQYGEDLFNTVIDENGIYDFGVYPDNRIFTENEMKFRYTLYGTAMAGIQLFIGPVLSLEVAGVYQRHLYEKSSNGNAGTYCLSESPGTYQSMAYTMKPASKHRLGVNVKLKINF